MIRKLLCLLGFHREGFVYQGVGRGYRVVCSACGKGSVPCSDCGATFDSVGAMIQHALIAHGVDADS